MASNSSPKILVVEDEALLLFSIADDLRDSGFEVLEATGADAALQLLKTNNDVRLVFTDVDMPGSMDGLGLVAIVRDNWPNIRIMVTSGKQRPVANKAPGAGVFVPKPYMSDSVAAMITSMLR